MLFGGGGMCNTTILATGGNPGMSCSNTGVPLPFIAAEEEECWPLCTGNVDREAMARSTAPFHGPPTGYQEEGECFTNYGGE